MSREATVVDKRTDLLGEVLTPVRFTQVVLPVSTCDSSLRTKGPLLRDGCSTED